MSLGDKLRGNASLLTTALRDGTLRRAHLFALAADLLDQAGEADRLAEAEAWLATEACGEPHMKTALREQGRSRSRREMQLPTANVRTGRRSVNRNAAP